MFHINQHEVVLQKLHKPIHKPITDQTKSKIYKPRCVTHSLIIDITSNPRLGEQVIFNSESR